MNEKHVDSLTEVIEAFLNFSRKCLEEGIINRETYKDITTNKEQFIRETTKQ